MNLAEKVIRIVDDILGYETEYELPESIDIINDLKGDSLDIVHIAMNIEDEFNIEISDEEMSSLYHRTHGLTIADIIALVEEKMRTRFIVARSSFKSNASNIKKSPTQLNISEIQLLRGLLFEHIHDMEEHIRSGNIVVAEEWKDHLYRTMTTLDDLEDELST